MEGSQGMEKGKNYIRLQKRPERALELSASAQALGKLWSKFSWKPFTGTWRTRK